MGQGNCNKEREAANRALRDVLHKIYVGVLYFLNVTRVYVTRVNGHSIGKPTHAHF